jgi:hypothetical protein
VSALPGYFRHQLFRYCQTVIDFDAEISDRAFDLGMTKQELNRSQIARPSIDKGRFCAAQGMCTKEPRVETDAADPLGHQPGILAGCHATGASLDLELRPDRPDVLRAERWLCPDQLSFVPGHSLGR